jgi:hypothetical protein
MGINLELAQGNVVLFAALVPQHLRGGIKKSTKCRVLWSGFEAGTYLLRGRISRSKLLSRTV